jgi:hypothetical protein
LGAQWQHHVGKLVIEFNMMRLIFGFVFVPLLLHVGYLFHDFSGQSSFLLRSSLIVHYVAIAFFGTPVVLLLLNRRWLSWWQSALGGMAAGSLFLVAWFGTSSWEHFLANGMRMIMVGLAYGVVTGLLFWACALRGNARWPAGAR